MDSKKVNVTNLVTVKNFAIKKRVTVQTVYRWIEIGQEEGIKIDGVHFVVNEPAFIKNRNNDYD